MRTEICWSDRSVSRGAAVDEAELVGGEGWFSFNENVDGSSNSLDSLVEVGLGVGRGTSSTSFSDSLNKVRRGRSRRWGRRRVGRTLLVGGRVCLRGCRRDVTIGEEKGDWDEVRVVAEVLLDVASEAWEFCYQFGRSGAFAREV